MEYKDMHRYRFTRLTSVELNQIKIKCMQYPPSTIIIDIPNTKGLTADILKQLPADINIRVAGGHTEERLNNYKDDPSKRKDYFERGIYTRNETIKIIERLEKLEKGINPNWSDMQKIVYIYDILKREIMYDSVAKNKSTKEKSSLRGLLSGKTVCAGFASIFKEMCDRQGIKCDYVSGYTKENDDGRHAWNVITIDGKMYPIDLTWENGLFRIGEYDRHHYLGRYVDDFNKKHRPDKRDPLYGYQSKLHEFNRGKIELADKMNAIEKEYDSTTFTFQRKDKTKFTIAQIGYQIIDNKKYYRYCYTELNADGTKQTPLILYSDTNVFGSLVNPKNWHKEIPAGYEDAIVNVLFSKENIMNSRSKGTCYIGGVNTNSKTNKAEYAKTPKDIEKNSRICYKFEDNNKRFHKSGLTGRSFIIQPMNKEPIIVEGTPIYYYEIFEYVNEDGKEVLKRNRVFSEQKLLNGNLKDEDLKRLLSRERLDRKVKEAGGYIGYYNKGYKYNTPKLKAYFANSKNEELSQMLMDKPEREDFDSIVKTS